MNQADMELNVGLLEHLEHLLNPHPLETADGVRGVSETPIENLLPVFYVCKVVLTGSNRGHRWRL